MLRLQTLGGLWIEGRAPVAVELRPRRLALLSILAAAGAKGASREQVLGILWSGSEPERARHSLSQAIYSIRRDLGVEVVLSTSTLRLDSAEMTSDVEAFRSAFAGKDWERASDAFSGPFLDGFYLADAPQFERWVEEQRASLSRDAIRAIEAVARRASADGDADQAIEAWRRLVKLDPPNPRFATAFMEALVATGDRAGALVHGQAHTDLVRGELEMEPDSKVLQLIEHLRESGPPAPRPLTRPMRAVITPSPPQSVSPTRSLPSRRAVWTTVFLAAVVGAIAAPLWRSRPTSSSSENSAASRSAVAARLYEDGLHAYYQFDAARASRLFTSALAEDSGFARAAYFAWRAEVAANGPQQDAFLARLASMAPRTVDRDRALIQTHLSATRADLRVLAEAETLAAHFPNDPEALVLAGQITNDLPRSVSLLDRAIALDSNASAAPTGTCRACYAFQTLAYRYAWADSSERFAQTVDRWSALRPGDYQPWQARADLYVSLGRRRDAEAASRRADSLGAPRGDTVHAALVRSLRLDDVDSLNTLCRATLPVVSREQFPAYRWLCTIGLRVQGRYRDALGLVRSGRVPWTNTVRRDMPFDPVHAAILDMEMGRVVAAAEQYASLTTPSARTGLPDGVFARHLAWHLTLSATALAASGDTVRVRALMDSVEVVGRRSLFPRDPLLHHFLRGLVLAQAGDHVRAVREYRAATSSPSQGYTRINYELGRSLLALHRAPEAIPVIRAALHGGVEGSGLYVTRTEFHELLAQAFAVAGATDSAAAHYVVVERSWRGADSAFAQRYAAAREWLLRAGRSAR